AEIGNHGSRLVALRAGFQIDGEVRLPTRKPGGRREAWIGSLLPGEVTIDLPQRYAPGSLAARRAAAFGAPVPVLALDGLDGHLRAWRDEDLDPVTLACQDPESAHWTTIPVPYTRSDALWYLHDHVPAEWARGRAAGFAIADATDRYVGSIDLRLGDPDGTSAEVGFLVAPWARGHGYASAALRPLGPIRVGLIAAMNVIDWLLDADPAIRWQVLRDLTDGTPDEVAAERARVEHEGWGACLLALEGTDGLWDGGACFPASYTGDEPGQPWTATMHTLQTLQIFGLDPACAAARRAIPLIAEH